MADLNVAELRNAYAPLDVQQGESSRFITQVDKDIFIDGSTGHATVGKRIEEDALVVVDMQNKFAGEQAQAGADKIADIRLTTANIGDAIDAAKARNIPIIALRSDGTTASSVSDSIFRDGPDGYVPLLQRKLAGYQNLHVVNKTTTSAFASSMPREELLRLFNANNARNIRFVGVNEGRCVFESVSDLLTRKDTSGHNAIINLSQTADSSPVSPMFDLPGVAEPIKFPADLYTLALPQLVDASKMRQN